MIVAAIAVSCVAAAGVWLIVSAIWPAPPDLAAAVTRLRDPGHLASTTSVSMDGSFAARVGAWMLRRGRSALSIDDRTRTDLELLGRPVELHAGYTVLAAIIGGLAGPVAWAVCAVVGIRFPVVFPVWLLIVGALVGWFGPRVVLRTEAAEARTDFRHALGSYLDVLVMLLAAQEGPESAMDLAARSGQGPAFDALRRAVRQARLSGEPVWETLDALGRRIGVVEVSEIAAAGSLAGESGAAVRRSLTAKARALRSTALTAAETSERQRSQRMFAPLVLMGLGFVLFLVYPLLTNLTIGGA